MFFYRQHDLFIQPLRNVVHMTMCVSRLLKYQFHLFIFSSDCNLNEIITSGADTAYPSGPPELIPVFSGVCVVQSLVFCQLYVIVCVGLSFIFWSLYCLSVFELWLLLTPLVSSNSSYYKVKLFLIHVCHCLNE